MASSMDMVSRQQQQVMNNVNGGEAAGAWLWAQAGHRLWATMPEHFWVYVYKVRKCPQPASHDWTSCPYAHKGERARRRDPRRYSYLAVSCPDSAPSNNNGSSSGGGGFKGSSCGRGLKCKYAHGVFELWLHPARFRTRLCEAGARCPRRICFFAHFRSQLREAGSSGSAGSEIPFLPPRILQRSQLPSAAASSSPPAPVDALAAAAAPASDDGLQAMADRMRLLALCSAASNGVRGGGGGMSSAFSAAPKRELVMVAPAPAPPPLHGGGISVFSAAAPTPELGMVVAPPQPLCSPGEEEDSASTDSGGDDEYPHVDLINDLVDD